MSFFAQEIAPTGGLVMQPSGVVQNLGQQTVLFLFCEGKSCMDES